MPLIKYSISPLLTKCTLEQKPGALGKVMEGGREGGRERGREGGAVEGGQDVALLPHYH